MTGSRFLRAPENCTLPQGDVGPIAHVLEGYSSRRSPTLPRVWFGFAGRFAPTKPDRYHDTITIAYHAPMRQCNVGRGNGGDRAAFAQINVELFGTKLL
jgi:hypothetical protein